MGFYRWLPALASVAYVLPSLAATISKSAVPTTAETCLWGKSFEAELVPTSLEDGVLSFSVAFRKAPEGIDSGIFGAYVVDDRGNVVGNPINARAQKVDGDGFKEHLKIPRLGDGFYEVHVSVASADSKSESLQHVEDEQVVYLEIVARDPILIPFEDWYERSRVARGDVDIETWNMMRRAVATVVDDSADARGKEKSAGSGVTEEGMEEAQ